MKSFLSAAKAAFFYFLRALFLILACALVGIVITLPFWYLATKFPHVYTIIILTILSLMILFKLVTELKKLSLRKIISILSISLTIILGLSSFIFLVLNGHRFIAFPLLIFIPTLCILISFLLNEDKN